ncbi:MAG TPA: DUF58 domain-containing protein [Thermoanaerobaculia bacterium]|nr:DUF58 domain-containing protein [Thermoanaerobaculia bacterium]
MARLVPEWGIRITNFGLGYILLCLVVAIGATNTGNNGLYLVLAAMLASMVVSGIVSRGNVRGVSCEVEAVGEVFARQPAMLKVRLENRLKRSTAQALFFLHEGLPGPLWIDPLAPGETREVFVEGSFSRRGVVREPDAGLLSRFPLGLFRKYRRALLAREVVVYPLPESGRVDEPPPDDARGGAEIRTLRDFVAGDDPRDLHWKQSARMRKWIVREREAERDRTLILTIDNAVPDPSDPQSLAALERTISRCSGQALVLLSRGAEVGLQARGVDVPAAAGRPQRARVLDALARLEAVPAASAPGFPPLRRGHVRVPVS